MALRGRGSSTVTWYETKLEIHKIRFRSVQLANRHAMGGLPVALLLLLVCKLSAGTRVSGVTKHSPLPTDDRNNNAPLYYLAKFGVASGQNLYVFGSVKTEDLFVTIRSGLLLVLVPQDVSDSLVAKHGVMSCNAVFESVLNESISVDDHTCPSGMKDYIRRLPCNNQDPLSCNQPNSIRVVPGNDFTFRVKESPKTEFYYLFMLACDRNYSSSCKWSETENSTLWYDISLVNSDPENNTHLNPFVYQFSLELEGVLLMQLLFSVVYLALLSIHLAMHFGLCGKWCKTSAIGFRRMHLLPAIFTASLVLEFLHVIFELIHYAVFAGDGFGAVWCLFLGEVFNQFSDWLLILVLLLIGKGWMVTDSALRWKKLTFGVWGAYVVFFSVYFIWAVVSVYTDVLCVVLLYGRLCVFVISDAFFRYFVPF